MNKLDGRLHLHLSFSTSSALFFLPYIPFSFRYLVADGNCQYSRKLFELRIIIAFAVWMAIFWWEIYGSVCVWVDFWVWVRVCVEVWSASTWGVW